MASRMKTIPELEELSLFNEDHEIETDSEWSWADGLASIDSYSPRRWVVNGSTSIDDEAQINDYGAHIEDDHEASGAPVNNNSNSDVSFVNSRTSSELWLQRRSANEIDNDSEVSLSDDTPFDFDEGLEDTLTLSDTFMLSDTSSGRTLPKGFMDNEALTHNERKGPFAFMNLIPELRNKVYKLLLTRDPTKERGAYPQILATCRRIHSEASGFLYSLNQVDVYVRRDAITWHGMSYSSPGNRSVLWPFKKPRPWGKPLLYPLQMARNLSIRIIHTQHPSGDSFPRNPYKRMRKELYFFRQLCDSMEWLVKHVLEDNRELKILRIQFELNNGEYRHPELLMFAESWLLVPFQEHMRGIEDARVTGHLWCPDEAVWACGWMERPLGVKFVRESVYLNWDAEMSEWRITMRESLKKRPKGRAQKNLYAHGLPWL